MILYREKFKESTEILLVLINKFNMVAGYKNNVQNQLYFHTLVLCSWIGRLDIVKTATFPDLIYMRNAIDVKLPTALF